MSHLRLVGIGVLLFIVLLSREANADLDNTDRVSQISSALAGMLLKSAHVSIIPADVSHKGQYFRLRIDVSGNLGKFCKALNAKGIQCVPVAN